MNLKQLEIFLAVAETGSFSRGAEATFITQSTASQHISSLESDFGVRLLDRTGRGALLTEGGKVLFQHARQVIDDVQAIHQAMRRFKGVEDVELRIGGSNIPANYMIPELLPVLLELFPTLRLTLIQGDSRDILEKLAREEIELGVVGSRFDEEGFEFAPLGRDEISARESGAPPPDAEGHRTPREQRSGEARRRERARQLVRLASFGREGNRAGGTGPRQGEGAHDLPALLPRQPRRP